MFGILFTLSQLRGEVLKILILKYLERIDHILKVKKQSYNQTRQMDAINRSFLIMQEATFILLRYMLQNEPANEEGLKQVKDLAIKIFGEGINNFIDQIYQQHQHSVQMSQQQQSEMMMKPIGNNNQ